MRSRTTNKKQAGWEKRKRRVRKKVSGTPERLRLNVYRSNKHIYAQLIDDTAGKVLFSASTLTKDLLAKAKKMNKTDIATQVGEQIGKLAKAKGVEKVVFDRGGFLYHGRIKAVAEGARGVGLKF